MLTSFGYFVVWQLACWLVGCVADWSINWMTGKGIVYTNGYCPLLLMMLSVDVVVVWGKTV